MWHDWICLGHIINHYCIFKIFYISSKTFFEVYSLKKLRTKIPHSPISSENGFPALQRQNAENLKQIFPEKEYRGLSPNFHTHVSVSELCILTMGLPVLLEEICRLILGI